MIGNSSHTETTALGTHLPYVTGEETEARKSEGLVQSDMAQAVPPSLSQDNINDKKMPSAHWGPGCFWLEATAVETPSD